MRWVHNTSNVKCGSISSLSFIKLLFLASLCAKNHHHHIAKHLSLQTVGFLAQDGIMRIINIHSCKQLFQVGSHDLVDH